MRFRLECPLSWAKSRSRGRLIAMFPRWSTSRKLREHCCRASHLRAGKFNNFGFFCLCYITKHLMTALSGNIEIRETKQTFPS